MSRRVGSPKALVTALTAALNSSASSTGSAGMSGILPMSVVEILQGLPWEGRRADARREPVPARLHQSPGDRLGQGWRREVLGYDEPRHRAGPAGQGRGGARRGRLGLLDA